MKIINFKKVNHDKIKANFDIEFSIGTISHFTLVSSHGKLFVSMPSSAYEKDGETKRKWYYYPPKEKEKDFQKKCIELLEPFIKENTHTHVQEEIPF